MRTPIPFDPDFDPHPGDHSPEKQAPKREGELPSGIPQPSSWLDNAHPLLTFYAGLACSVLVFGLAGIIWLVLLMTS